ncbi:cell division cycle-associated protein 4 isoform X1 [Sinocyclocheilus grahami]|nr:PREDICTED: cell division cycle-associated protein 4-like isoform X1 [Sinocyclocheilus grahami]
MASIFVVSAERFIPLFPRLACQGVLLGCHPCFRLNMFSKGTKRKFSDGGEEISDESLLGARVASSYSLQRQSLLDMSLIKLQLCHMLVEPNLCRSVLIANTVRQIQEEMTHDGSWHMVTEAFCSAGQSPSERLVATEVLCRSREQDAEPKLFSVISYEGCCEEEVVADETLCSVSVSDTVSNVCLAGRMGQCWEKSELSGIERDEEALEDSRLGSGEEEEIDTEDGASTESPKTIGQVFGTFEIKNGSPGPDSALEELFSDVDTSYYDLDTMLTGMQSAPKMGPYDLLDSLAPSHSSPSIVSTPNCRSDLNELDHIMEIIVGS